ncbi:Diflavin flavoprotein A 1 [Thalassoglobus neptunius]|uniref:Diflavin flavoprotein A 1 n=1 Tax=Thalassoglobus neptunius TaxID=1938619 RepID=A0A5C5WJN7_9PLAN|nr:flavin reductase family protein [Thalassoglobus neptunius]TWT50062.1 Diflavin flavoprotein A 1 [Thalassoglobus neptunius]
MNVENIGPVLGKIPSGVFILTAQNGDGLETGMLASWVQQSSFEPPTMTVAVNKKRYLNDWIKESSDLAVSLVAESEKQLLSHFGKGFEPEEPAFEGLATEKTSTGLTVLNGSLGWLAGRVRSSVDAGDHTVYVVEITEGKPGESVSSEKPFVHLRKNGFGY